MISWTSLRSDWLCRYIINFRGEKIKFLPITIWYWSDENKLLHSQRVYNQWNKSLIWHYTHHIINTSLGMRQGDVLRPSLIGREKTTQRYYHKVYDIFIIHWKVSPSFLDVFSCVISWKQYVTKIWYRFLMFYLLNKSM
jgi:hypothetical protein